MRTVARYSLVAKVPETRDEVQDYLRLLDLTEAWLSGKGHRLEHKKPEEILKYPDGREAEIRRWELDIGVEGLREVILGEPIDAAALFETRLLVGLVDRSLAILCDLLVGGRDEPLGPVRFDASCPRVVREFLAYDLPWSYGSFPLAKSIVQFRGVSAGEEFVRLLTDPARLLPIVAISEYGGLVLHPSLPDGLNRDVAALAVVAVLDEAASWRTTALLGAAWACYNGALRLYWPGLDSGGDPRGHPLWTARRLLDDVADTSAAAARIRNVLRRQIMSASAFAIREPSVFSVIRSRERTQRFARERDKLKSTEHIEKLAESYAHEADELKGELEDKGLEIESLRKQVENLQIALRWRDAGGEDSLVPDSQVPPATVADAVARARVECGDALAFGPDVEKGVGGLAPDAGPPDKVLLYLTRLAELSRERAKGNVGTSTLDWLKRRNISASQEGEGVTRLWSGRVYDWHLKPAEAVSPDRCIRIYFDWDDAGKRMVVGWVGRHP